MKHIDFYKHVSEFFDVKLSYLLSVLFLEILTSDIFYDYLKMMSISKMKFKRIAGSREPVEEMT